MTSPFSGVENHSQHLYINIITQLERTSQETESAAWQRAKNSLLHFFYVKKPALFVQ